VLWEVSETSSGFGNLGVTIGQASIARLNDGSWAAVFGNGYNSSDEKASLFIVNAATGALIKEIPAALSDDPEPGSNGLSTPLLVT
jgi:type IV pilus assembly protein PilY1